MRLPRPLRPAALALALAAAPAARADWLDPASFASLGALNLASGSYTIETDGAPVLKDSGGNVLYTGTTYAQGGTYNPTVSVLTFSSISIASGVTITAVGQNPLALLSQSDLVLYGVIAANGQNGHDSPRLGGDGLGGAGGAGGGAGGDSSQAGVGPGGGPGTPGGLPNWAGGGGYGGHGGASDQGLTGPAYGDLHQYLLGGSGGGGGGGNLFQAAGAGGGGGGGGIELGASGSILFGENSALTANAGLAGGGFASNAGGGSGGGLLIHAPTIETRVGSVISALGGAYFGGGGRILFLTDTATINQRGGTISAGAGGGANDQENGVVEYDYLRARAVPEPATLAMGLTAAVGVAALVRRRAIG